MASSSTIETLTKMLEALPEHVQERILEHMREYIEEIRDETKWDASFTATQGKVVAAASKARKEIQENKATPMDMRPPSRLGNRDDG